MGRITVTFVAKTFAALILLASTSWWVQDDGESVPALADLRPEGATAAAWSAVDAQVKAFFGSLGITGYIEAAFMHPSFATVQRFFYSESRAQYDHAQRYFEEQRPLVLESARRFDLHGYWSKHMKVDSPDISWTELLTQRVRSMRAQLEEGREDHRVEKDKCDMLRWLERNEFPIPKVVGIWQGEAEAFLADLFELPSNSSWPLFAKSCHLTQGVEDSVRRIRSRDQILEHKEDWTAFIKHKWLKKTNDADRIFADDSNALSRDLAPGFVLQHGFPDVVEFKVLVIWGRAYVGYFIENEGLVCRDGTWEQGDRARPWSTSAPVPISQVPEVAWVEDRLDRVWMLAEAVALAAGNDQMRVDIFVSRLDPQAIAVNEISLSSGQSMYMHTEFVTKLWAEPYLTGTFRPFSADVPVHKLDVKTGKVPNYQAFRSALQKVADGR